MDILSRGEISYRAYRKGRKRTTFAKMFQSVEEAGISTEDQVAFAAYLSDRHLNGGTPARPPGLKWDGALSLRTFFEEALKPKNLKHIYEHTRPSTIERWKEKVRQIRCQY